MLERNTHSCINVQGPFRSFLLSFLFNVGGRKIGQPLARHHITQVYRVR